MVCHGLGRGSTMLNCSGGSSDPCFSLSSLAVPRFSYRSKDRPLQSLTATYALLYITAWHASASPSRSSCGGKLFCTLGVSRHYHSRPPLPFSPKLSHGTNRPC